MAFDLGTAVLTLTADQGPLQGAVKGGLGIVAGFATAAAGLLIGVGVASVSMAAEFEQSLAGVASATGATKEQLALMRTEALGIGKDTSKSASEAVEAMGELTKAGMDVNLVVGGAARSVVQLAEATGSTVAAMASVVANSVTIFKAGGTSAAEAAELIGRTANASSISTGDFAQSLKAVGSVAALAGLSMRDFSIVTGVLGNNALIGADGGTSLKTMLLALAAPSTKAVGLLRGLGIEAYDTNEKIKPFREILISLQAGFAGMSEASRNANLAAIFGNDAVRAGIILLEQGVEGFDAFGAALDAAPTLAEQSAIRLATFNGVIDQMKGSLETAGITIGAAFLPLLTKMASAALVFINSIDFEKISVGFGAFIGLLTEGDPAKRLEFFNVLSTVVGGDIAEKIALVTSGIIGLFGMLTGNADGTERLKNALVGLFGEETTAFIGRFIALVMQVGGFIGDLVGRFVSWQDVMIAIGGIVAVVVVPAILAAIGTMALIAGAVAAVILVVSGLRNAWEQDFGHVRTFTEAAIAGVIITIGGVKQLVTDLTTGLGIMQTAWGNMSAIVNGAVLDALKGVTLWLGNAWDAAGKLAGTLGSIRLPSLPSLPGLAAGTDYWRGGMAMVGEAGPELLNLPRGSQVIPTERLDSFLGTGGGVSLTMGDINIDATGADREALIIMMDNFGNNLIQKIRRALQANLSSAGAAG